MLERNHKEYTLSKEDLAFVNQKVPGEILMLHIKDSEIRKSKVKTSSNKDATQLMFPKRRLAFFGPARDIGDLQGPCNLRYFETKSPSTKEGRPDRYSPESSMIDKRTKAIVKKNNEDLIFYLLKTSTFIEGSEACKEGTGIYYIYDPKAEAKTKLNAERIKAKINSEVFLLEEDKAKKIVAQFAPQSVDRGLEELQAILIEKVQSVITAKGAVEAKKYWDDISKKEDAIALRTSVHKAISTKLVFLLTTANAATAMKSKPKGWYFLDVQGNVTSEGYICPCTATGEQAELQLYEKIAGDKDLQYKLNAMIDTNGASLGDLDLDLA